MDRYVPQYSQDRREPTKPYHLGLDLRVGYYAWPLILRSSIVSSLDYISS